MIYRYFLIVSMLLSIPPTNACAQEDPVWVERYDGSGGLHDYSKAVTIDNSGAIIVVGKTWSDQGNYDPLTLKYSPDGVLLWSSAHDGGSNVDDSAVSVTVSLQGDIYVGCISPSPEGNSDYLLIKYSPSGGIVWTERYNNGGNDQIAEVATDIFGNVLITGSSVGGYGWDYTTIKYASDGTQLWVQRFNGNGSYGNDDYGYALNVDREGNVYVTGSSWQRRNGFNKPSIGTVKYSSDGIYQWAAHRWEYSPSVGLDVTSDNAGNVYVVGYEGSFSGYQATNYVTLKYNSAGAGVWTQLYNGPASNYDYGRKIAVDQNNNVFVTGESYASASSYDIMTLAYSTGGSILGSHRYDGPISDNDYANDIVYVDPDGILVIGTSPGEGTSSDIVSILYDDECNIMDTWPRRFNNDANLSDRAVAVAVDESGTYVTGTSDGDETFFDIITLKYDGPGSPEICLSSTSLSFEATTGGENPLSKSFNVSNCGGGTLDWYIDEQISWLDITPYQGTSNSQEIIVSVNSTSLAPGNFNGVITVTSSNADNSPQTIDVTYTVSAIRPIFLVYGLSDNEDSWSSMKTWLEANGYQYVYAVDNILPCGSWTELHFADNAQLLSDYIDQKVEALEASSGTTIEQIDIIGHSMGGLIARRYNSSTSTPTTTWTSKDVRKLIMLGTPNKGSGLTNPTLLAFVFKCPEGVAVLELTPFNIMLFNSIYEDDQATDYYSFWGSRGTKIDCYKWGVPGVFLGRPNDGAVSRNSAVRDFILGPGVLPYYDNQHGDNWCHSYRGCSSENGTYLEDVNLFDDYIKPILDGQDPFVNKGYDLDTIPDTPPQIAAENKQSIIAGTMSIDSFFVESNSNMTVAVFASDAMIAFTIESPFGIIYDSTLPPGDSTQVYYSDSLGTSGYYIENAEEGYWQWTVDAQNAETSPVDFLVMAALDNSVLINCSQSAEYPDWADTLVLNVSITDNEVGITGLDVSALPIWNNQDTASILPFYDDGLHNDNEPNDGIYGMLISDYIPGCGEYKIHAFGTGPSGQLNRMLSLYACLPTYFCGDANSDMLINVGDAVFLINYIFRSGPAPEPLEAGDSNCDGNCNVGDAVYLINYIFRSGQEPCCP